jgi:hypothetical protein
MQPTILPEPRMTMRLSGFVGWVVLETAFRAAMAAKREGEILGLTAVLPVATAKIWHP